MKTKIEQFFEYQRITIPVFTAGDMDKIVVFTDTATKEALK